MTSTETTNTTSFKARDILFSPQDRKTKIYGKTFDDWTTEWWKQQLAIPKQYHPGLIDNPLLNTCVFDDNVIFLAGTFDYQNQIIQNVKIPSGFALLFPIINSTNSYAEEPDKMKTIDDLYVWAKDDIRRIGTMFMTINDQNVFVHDYEVRNYSCISRIFEMRYEQDNIWDIKPGKTTAVSIGWWAFIKPLALPPGEYKIHVGGQCLAGKIKIDVLYNLTIQ